MSNARDNPSIDLHDLNESSLRTILAAGRVVELRDSRCVLGKIVPEGCETAVIAMPDFAARAQAIFGDRLLPGSEILFEDRERR